MVSDSEYIRHEALEIGFYITLGVVMSIILPLFVGFGLRGFEETFVAGRPIQFGDLLFSYLIYYVLIIGALFVIVFPIMNLIYIKKGEHPATQPNPTISRVLTVSLIHNPEQGAIYTLLRKLGFRGEKNALKWAGSLLRVLIISTILFAGLGALSLTLPKAQVVGIPTNQFLQQITPFTEVIFTAEPPAFAETGIMMFVFLLILGVLAFFTARYQLGIAFFFVVGLLVVCPLIGFGWVGFHNIVYGASDQARFSTFIFGWGGSTLTLLFGTYLPWYSWHFWNNIFAKMREIAPSNEDVIFLSWAIWGALVLLYITVEVLLFIYKRKRRKAGGVPEPRF